MIVALLTVLTCQHGVPAWRTLLPACVLALSNSGGLAWFIAVFLSGSRASQSALVAFSVTQGLHIAGWTGLSFVINRRRMASTGVGADRGSQIRAVEVKKWRF
jgi:hypothetical protein